MGDTRPAAALEAVLRRVPPRGLGACRCVCRKWRAIVDSRRLLRPDLLPLSVGGIFLSLGPAQAPPALFARPSPAARGTILAGRQLERFVETGTTILTVLDCCNGLLLHGDDLVVNPPTRRSAPVPPCPAPAWSDGYGLGDAYLAFDPSVSPHYEVILIQDPSFFEDELEDASEWPPPSYTVWIYSSRTRGWEETPFARYGDPAGTLGEARTSREPDTRHAVHWHGALYVHCTGDFIIRLALSDCKYQVIKLPEGVNSPAYFYHHLSKSKNGVYFALASPGFQLQAVWLLNEVNGKMEWLFKYDINLQVVDAHFKPNRDYPLDRPWILRNGYYKKGNNNSISSRGEKVEEWDSDDDNVLEIEGGGEEGHSGGLLSILGFHPFKEVAFLELSSGRVVACHLDSSKLQDLGWLSLGYHGNGIDTTFVYTPCWIGELSEHKKCICMCGV